MADAHALKRLLKGEVQLARPEDIADRVIEVLGTSTLRPLFSLAHHLAWRDPERAAAMVARSIRRYREVVTSGLGRPDDSVEVALLRLLVEVSAYDPLAEGGAEAAARLLDASRYEGEAALAARAVLDRIALDGAEDVAFQRARAYAVARLGLDELAVARAFGAPGPEPLAAACQREADVSPDRPPLAVGLPEAIGRALLEGRIQPAPAPTTHDDRPPLDLFPESPLRVATRPPRSSRAAGLPRVVMLPLVVVAGLAVVALFAYIWMLRTAPPAADPPPRPEPERRVHDTGVTSAEPDVASTPDDGPTELSVGILGGAKTSGRLRTFARAAVREADRSAGQGLPVPRAGESQHVLIAECGPGCGGPARAATGRGVVYVGAIHEACLGQKITAELDKGPPHASLGFVHRPNKPAEANTLLESFDLTHLMKSGRDATVTLVVPCYAARGCGDALVALTLPEIDGMRLETAGYAVGRAIAEWAKAGGHCKDKEAQSP